MFISQRILVSVLIALVPISVYSQRQSARSTTTKNTRLQSVCIDRIGEHWELIDLGFLSFCSPVKFQLEKKRAIDSSVLGYDNNVLRVRVYSGANAPTIGATEQKLSSYNE